jgi:hypothetical protein
MLFAQQKDTGARPMTVKYLKYDPGPSGGRWNPRINQSDSEKVDYQSAFESGAD